MLVGAVGRYIYTTPQADGGGCRQSFPDSGPLLQTNRRRPGGMHQSESGDLLAKRVNHCLDVFSRDLDEFREQPVSGFPEEEEAMREQAKG